MVRLRPLQCGEAYYSVHATNNLECDKPFWGRMRIFHSIKSIAYGLRPKTGPQVVVLRPQLPRKDAAVSDTGEGEVVLTSAMEKAS